MVLLASLAAGTAQALAGRTGNSLRTGMPAHMAAVARGTVISGMGGGDARRGC